VAARHQSPSRRRPAAFSILALSVHKGLRRGSKPARAQQQGPTTPHYRRTRRWRRRAQKPGQIRPHCWRSRPRPRQGILDARRAGRRHTLGGGWGGRNNWSGRGRGQSHWNRKHHKGLHWDISIGRLMYKKTCIIGKHGSYRSPCGGSSRRNRRRGRSRKRRHGGNEIRRGGRRILGALGGGLLVRQNKPNL
jgi:hypothetical protein